MSAAAAVWLAGGWIVYAIQPVHAWVCIVLFVVGIVVAFMDWHTA